MIRYKKNTILTLFLATFLMVAFFIDVNETNAGLVGHWKFDEGSGSRFNDSSGKNNTGSCSGSSCPSSVSGKYGRAAQFDGSSDYINLGSGSSLGVFRGGNWSVSTWINPTGANFYTEGIIFMGVYQMPGIWYETQRNSILFEIRKENLRIGPIVRTDPGTMLPNGWHHLVVTSNRSNYKVYIDGAHSASSAYQSMTSTYTMEGGYVAGGRNHYYGKYKGAIDDLRVYDHALSQSEIVSLYGSTPSPPSDPPDPPPPTNPPSAKSGLLGHWTMDSSDISGNIIKDKSGNGRDGVIGSSVRRDSNGKFGQALDINGSRHAHNNAVINVKKTENLNPQKFSISAWYKLKGSLYRELSISVIGKDTNDSSFDGFGIYFNNNTNEICFYVSNYKYNSSCAKFKRDSKWHHVTGTFDGSNIKFYLDGGGPIVKSLSGIYHKSNVYMRIGGKSRTPWTNGAGWTFPGSIDEVRLYSYALSKSNVISLYGGKPVVIIPGDGPGGGSGGGGDDGDDGGPPPPPVCVDNDGDGFNRNNVDSCGLFDCNDSVSAMHPGGEEICDGLDNNCNGQTDEDACPDPFVTTTPDTTAPETTASFYGGDYDKTIAVALVANESATIYYTTDGSTPTTSSSTYSSPIDINSSTTLKFFSVDTAGNSESIKTESYVMDTSCQIIRAYWTPTFAKPGTTVTLTVIGKNCDGQEVSLEVIERALSSFWKNLFRQVANAATTSQPSSVTFVGNIATASWTVPGPAAAASTSFTFTATSVSNPSMSVSSGPMTNGTLTVAATRLVQGGIVPCGRSADDSLTPEDETAVCNLCHLIVGIKRLVDYGVKLLLYLSIVAIVGGSIAYIISVGNEQLMGKAKNIMKVTLYAFAIILIAWVLITFTMTIIGTKTDLGVTSGEKWYEFYCS